jgi:hypothetical protein
MLLCDDYSVDLGNERRYTIHGLMSSIRAIDDPPYPLLYEGFCVFLALTSLHRAGVARIVCVDQASGQAVFATPECAIPQSSNPLNVEGVGFRIRNCLFPHPGMYSVQFLYEGRLVHECPLLLR